MQNFEILTEEMKRTLMEIHNLAQSLTTEIYDLKRAVEQREQQIVDLKKQLLALKSEVKK